MKIDFPLHRFNLPAYQAWSAKGIGQKAMAKALNRIYGTRTVGVVSPVPLHMIAVVSPTGSVQELRRPYIRVEFWQLANAPNIDACQCSSFADHENGGRPWRERGAGTHHPLCQYDAASMGTFIDLARRGNVATIDPAKMSNGGFSGLSGTVPERPDQWTRSNASYRESSGLGSR